MKSKKRLREYFAQPLKSFHSLQKNRVSLALYSERLATVLSFFWIRNRGYLSRQLNQFLRSGLEYSALVYLTGMNELLPLVAGALILDLASKAYQENLILQVRNIEMRGAQNLSAVAKGLFALVPLGLLFAYSWFVLKDVRSVAITIYVGIKVAEHFVGLAQFFATYELQIRKRVYFPSSINYGITGLIGAGLMLYGSFEDQSQSFNVVVVGLSFGAFQILETFLSYLFYKRAIKLEEILGSPEGKPAEGQKLPNQELSSVRNVVMGLVPLLSRYAFICTTLLFESKGSTIFMILAAEATLGKLIERSFRSVYIDIVAAYRKGSFYHVEKLLAQSSQFCVYAVVLAAMLLMGSAVAHPALWIGVPWVLLSLSNRAFFYFVYSIGMDEGLLRPASVLRFAAAIVVLTIASFNGAVGTSAVLIAFTLAEIGALGLAAQYLRKFEIHQMMRFNVQQQNWHQLENRTYGAPAYFELKALIQKHVPQATLFSARVTVNLWKPVKNPKKMRLLLEEIRRSLRITDLVMAQDPQTIEFYLSGLSDSGLHVLLKRLLCRHAMLIKSYAAMPILPVSRKVHNKALRRPLGYQFYVAKFSSLLLDLNSSIEMSHSFYSKDKSGMWKDGEDTAEKELQFFLTKAEQSQMEWPFLQHLKVIRAHEIRLSMLPVTIHGQVVGFYVASKINLRLLEMVRDLQQNLTSTADQYVFDSALSPEIFSYYSKFLTNILERFHLKAEVREISKGIFSKLEGSLIHCSNGSNLVKALVLVEDKSKEILSVPKAA